MSSEKGLVSKNARFTSKRTSRNSRPKDPHDHLWRQETPNRSSSRSRTAVTKKIKVHTASFAIFPLPLHPSQDFFPLFYPFSCFSTNLVSISS